MRASWMMLLFALTNVVETFTFLRPRLPVFSPTHTLHSSSPLSSSPMVSMDEPEKTKPSWAAGGFVSDLVNALIKVKPLFFLMKLGARQQLISTAEKNGVPWRERAMTLEKKKNTLDRYYRSVFEDSIEYPEYYTQEFHAYDEGNLNWKAAYECEQATMSMALRVWPTECLTPKAAQDRLRSSFIDSVSMYIDDIQEQSMKSSSPTPLSSASLSKSKFPSMNSSNQKTSNMQRLVDEQEETARRSSKNIKSIVDLGCSVGVSTFYLAEAFPSSTILGIDLSPQFLAVAKERQWSYPVTSPVSTNIEFLHCQAEKMDSLVETGSKDLVTASFMFHELPQKASCDILKEMYRITAASGYGTVAITDNNPKSPVIQNLPPPIFTLMKSTEPWSDEYYAFDLEQAMRQVGFVDVITIDTDPRHRTVLGRKPVQ